MKPELLLLLLPLALLPPPLLEQAARPRPRAAIAARLTALAGYLGDIRSS